MLNLVFNYSDDSALNGRFMDYNPNQNNKLLASKVWYQTVANAPDPPDANDPDDWELFQGNKQHITFPLNQPSTVWVRVADYNQATDNFNARITVVMGRNDQKTPPQLMSSPIQDATGVTTGPLCIWDPCFFVIAQPQGAGNASWLVQMGQATQGLSGKVNNYLFVVAATCMGSTPLGFPQRTFSHDPDMDISC